LPRNCPSRVFGSLEQTGSNSVTQLLLQWRAGDKAALEALVPLVYKDLCAVAHHYLRGERPEHTLQSAALVHEAYLRLVSGSPVPTENRAHFVAVAARLMRQILVDHARAHGAGKRGAGCKIELGEAVEPAQVSRKDLVALDDALNALTKRDEQQGQVVELRCFGGLTIEETAEVLKISPATVKRDWNMAKAWLSRQMRRNYGGKHGSVGQT
jgi:RNA polymerase sigma factor (TIGR02999 family)